MSQFEWPKSLSISPRAGIPFQFSHQSPCLTIILLRYVNWPRLAASCSFFSEDLAAGYQLAYLGSAQTVMSQELLAPACAGACNQPQSCQSRSVLTLTAAVSVPVSLACVRPCASLPTKASGPTLVLIPLRKHHRRRWMPAMRPKQMRDGWRGCGRVAACTRCAGRGTCAVTAASSASLRLLGRPSACASGWRRPVSSRGPLRAGRRSSRPPHARRAAPGTPLAVAMGMRSCRNAGGTRAGGWCWWIPAGAPSARRMRCARSAAPLHPRPARRACRPCASSAARYSARPAPLPPDVRNRSGRAGPMRSDSATAGGPGQAPRPRWRPSTSGYPAARRGPRRDRGGAADFSTGPGGLGLGAARVGCQVLLAGPFAPRAVTCRLMSCECSCRLMLRRPVQHDAWRVP
jgi:hypothetical protein